MFFLVLVLSATTVHAILQRREERRQQRAKEREVLRGINNIAADHVPGDPITLSGHAGHLSHRTTAVNGGTAANGTATNGTAANGTAANGTAANGMSNGVSNGTAHDLDNKSSVPSSKTGQDVQQQGQFLLWLLVYFSIDIVVVIQGCI